MAGIVASIPSIIRERDSDDESWQDSFIRERERKRKERKKRTKRRKKRTKGKRKAPIKHIVHKHYRNGKLIEEYDRGKGKSSSSRAKTRRKTPAPRSRKPKAYTVNFMYSKKKDDGESFLVIARSYEHALAEALEEKKDERHPIEVSIIDPSIGQVLRYIGRGATKAVKLGATYTIRGGKGAVKKGGRFAIARIKDEYTKRLINHAYSEDRAKRAIARLRLKKEYPDVYHIMDFSRR